MSLELIQTPDILGSAREKFGYEGILIGFAAETESLEMNARTKLNRKNCDLIIANDISRKDIGFDVDENEILIISADNTETPVKASKQHLSRLILRHALDLAASRNFD